MCCEPLLSTRFDFNFRFQRRVFFCFFLLLNSPPPPQPPVALLHYAEALAFAAGEEQARAGLPVAPDEFVTATLRFGLTEVVHEWARGTKFAEICQYTDVQARGGREGWRGLIGV